MGEQVMRVLKRFAEDNGYEYSEAKVLKVNPWRYVKRVGKNLMVSWYYDPYNNNIVAGFSCKVGKKWYYDGWFETITDFSKQGVVDALKRCLGKSVEMAFKEVLYKR